MITHTLLDKSEKDNLLPELFDLYYNNMSQIAPSGLCYEAEQIQWLAAVSPALEKAPRQILLCRNGYDILGYIQYYTRDDLLMIEELQLRGDYQRSTVFISMVRALIRLLPEGLRHVEAYADKRNLASLALMQRLGMLMLNDEDESFAHLRGDAGKIRSLFLHR